MATDRGASRVVPAPPPLDNWPRLSAEDEKRCRLNFVVMNYIVQSVSVAPFLDQPAVTLTFIEASEMPADPEAIENGTFSLAASR